MSNDFAAAPYTIGQLNALVKMMKKQAGDNAVERFLSGQLKVSELWHEENGIIYFSVTSNGVTGSEWVKRLESKGIVLNDRAIELLFYALKPSNGITTRIAVLKENFFSSDNIVPESFRILVANEQNFVISNLEIACLIRDKFTDNDIKTMGLDSIVVMHHMSDSDIGGMTLHKETFRIYSRTFHAGYGDSCSVWEPFIGSALVCSQV
jgi:hypothetical protein